MTFRELGLIAPIVEALEEQGYVRPSPIQEKAIPPALQGRDVLGCAQTGTGKTCAFAAPILQRLDERINLKRTIRSLILTPTRELAIQIGESFDAYGKNLPLRSTVIFGGVGQGPQVEQLKRGVDILVATPGRLGDLYQQGFLDLSHIEVFVLDEADRMLDMGFIHDVRKILKWLPAKKQTLFFSATMPPEITDLVNSLLHDPARVAVDPISSPVEVIEQSVYFVDRGNKTKLLSRLMDELAVKSALVFTRTKHGANKVARDLEKSGIPAAAIHGNKSQSARQQALADFKAGRVRALVATDIAARGLDIEELSHVFNYNLPEVPETYVHRIGRTGRAGKGGTAVALCDYSEKPLLKDIEKLIGKKVPVMEGHPWPMEVFEAAVKDKNGRLVNADDAEARAAARELKKSRDEAKAAQQAREAEKQAVSKAQPAPAPEEKTEPTRSKRRKKKTSAAQAEPEPLAPEPEELPLLPVREERVRTLRPGALMDTGDSMPCTDFYRPNPLDSDVIMDATARLLAPRKVTLTPQTAPERTQPAAPAAEEEKRSSKNRKKRKKSTSQGSQSAQTSPKAEKKSAKPAPSQEQKRRSRPSGGRRGMPEPPSRSRTKDSTQQKSLMKPYYLDI